MTKTKCAFCSFVGHGYQMKPHQDREHTVHIDAEINRVTKDYAIIKLNGIPSPKIPYKSPKGEIVFIEVYQHGRTRFPIIEEQ